MQRECQARRWVDSRDTQAVIARVFSNIRAQSFCLPGGCGDQEPPQLPESDNLRRARLTTQGHARKSSLICKCTLILDQQGVRRLFRVNVNVRKAATRVTQAAAGCAHDKTGPRKEKAEAPGDRPLSCPITREDYWLNGGIPAGHSGGAGAGLTPRNRCSATTQKKREGAKAFPLGLLRLPYRASFPARSYRRRISEELVPAELRWDRTR